MTSSARCRFETIALEKLDAGSTEACRKYSGKKSYFELA